MSFENPKVSVIMPTLNDKTYIRQCLESVVNQTLTDIEIIVVDAGSTDGSLEIINEFINKDSRITLLTSDKKSYGHQMNLGISNANGKYIGIVETDDYIDKTMFEELYDLSNNADIVKSSFIYVNEDTDEIFKDKNIHKQKIPENKIFNLKDNAYILTGHPSIWAGIYKRGFLELNDIKFVEAPGGGWVDNQFFHETACLAKTIIYTDEAYYYYRESNPNSSSNKLNDLSLPIRRMIENLEIINKYPECKSEDVLKVVYWRVNIYMDNIQSREKYEEELPQLRPLIKEMMDMLEESIVRKYFNLKDQQRYFSFKSPLRLIEDKDKITISSREYNEILIETDFLNLAIDLNNEEIEKLKKQNKKLKNENKKLKKLYKSLLNSSSWKLTKPFRWLKRLFK